MPDAIGIVEMYGYVAAMKAADAAAKAADVKIIAIDTNRPANPKTPVPLITVVKMQGTVSAVTAAVEAAADMANQITGLIQKHIIARPTENTQKMALRSSVGKEKVGHIKNNG